MRTNHFIYIAALTVVSGCTVQSLGNGGYQLSTPSLASILNSSGEATTNSGGSPAYPSSQTSTDPSTFTANPGDKSDSAMKFTGQLDGGVGNIVLTPISGDQYNMELGVKGQDAGAGVSGTVTRVGNTFTMTEGHDSGLPPEPCNLILKLNGNMLSVAENYKAGGGCMIFHGASISFNGTLSQVDP